MKKEELAQRMKWFPVRVGRLQTRPCDPTDQVRVVFRGILRTLLLIGLQLGILKVLLAPKEHLVFRVRVQVGINSTALIQGDPAGRITPTARHHGPLVRPLGPHRFRMVVWRLHTDVIILVHTDEGKV